MEVSGRCEAFKTQFACRLWHQHFAPMAISLLISMDKVMAFTTVWAECLSVFGTQSKKIETAIFTNVAKSNINGAEQLVKLANQ